MKADELKKKYIDFFVKKGHKKLPNLSLMPENDPTTLFISAGMQPLMPYLLGEPHPLGKRLVSLQRCLRTGDIEEVGNVFHNTFFEMLGNWSLGDYWKRESLSWSYEFLTKILGLNPKRFHVTIFKGDKNAPKDEESEKIWLSLGIPKERIYPLPKKDNWWETGGTGPGGPDSEIFYDIGKPACGPSCRPGDNCGRFFEMWNNVFMEYNRKPDGSYEKLKQKNVDTGMGVERTTAVLEGKENIYQTELFAGLVNQIEKISGQKYDEKTKKPMRIITDHLRAAVFLLGDGVLPSNVDQGYILRRLIRRAVRYGRLLQVRKPFVSQVAKVVINGYQEDYLFLEEKKKEIFQELAAEEKRFSKTLERGLKEFEKLGRRLKSRMITGQQAFYLYETYGFPLEMTEELGLEEGFKVDKKEFEQAQKKHQEKSRVSLEKKFAGGLADHSKEVTKLHTATHLLHQALRDVLGEHVRQVGSNITAERLRFDFTHSEKLTEEQIKKVEKIVNQKIKENLPVKMEVMTLAEAKQKDVLAFFSERYGEKVKIYLIGDYSKEVCGGPHVDFTEEIGSVKIIKEKPVGAGRRRIYAELAHGS
ncbi:MAG TPA: alanine--tRNA ligase [Nevskiaceae bacterium]|nr:alanine--tRNA ligase [Nevskiaceae bacterium]